MKYLCLILQIIWWALVIGLTIAIVITLTSCQQRECTYLVDPNGVVIGFHYKSNSIATDTNADRVKITTRSGVVIELNGVRQQQDSIKASAIVAGVPVVIETKGE